MTDEIFDGIRSVFNHDYDLFLLPQDIYSRMKRKGFFKNVEYKKAMVDIQISLRSPVFFRRRTDTSDGWGLARHFRSTEKQEENQQDISASQLQIGKEIKRTISSSGAEIKDGTIPLNGQNFGSFFASMDKEQQKRLNINIHSYADEDITCTIVEGDRDNWFLQGTWLRNWYKENRIEPGDEIYLVVENTTPLIIRIYTTWERNPDTYRRYKLRQEANPLPSVDLPIWQLIREFFEQTQKIEHRLAIWKAVFEKRPEISEQSVYACLSANPYLFVRVGEGNWGLKDWGLEEVKAAVRPAGSTLEENLNLPTTTVSLGYILATIAAENLVYRILEESPNPLSVGEITERISKILGVNKELLTRATYFDRSDPRFHRQEDGTFTLDRKIKNLEEVIHQLSENERALKTSTENKIQKLQETMESFASQHKKEVKQLKEERDSLRKLAEELIEQTEHYEKINNQREKRIQLLSIFLMEAIPYIGQDKLKEIFEHLHRKSELRSIIDSDEIIKFSKIVHRFLPRIQD